MARSGSTSRTGATAMRPFIAATPVLMLAPELRGLTLIPPTDLAALAKASDAVVYAEALDSKVVGKELLAPRTRFRVHRTLSGSPEPNETIVVETPGGVGETHAIVISGAPTFESGARYLLCLLSREGAWILRLASYGLHAEDTDTLGRVVLRPLSASHHHVLSRPDGPAVETVSTYEPNALLEHQSGVFRGKLAWDRSRVELAGPVARAAIPDDCRRFSVVTPNRPLGRRIDFFNGLLAAC